MITYLFPPGLDMGAQACGQIARYLPLYGWEPVVLTVRERYIEHLDPRDNRGFPGTVIRTSMIPHPVTIYKRLKLRRRHGVEGSESVALSVRRTGLLQRWVLSLLLVPDTCTGWILPAVISGLEAVRRRGVVHLFSSGPYWTSHLVGLALARASGLPWTAHFRDPWTAPLAEWQQFKPVSAASFWLEEMLQRMVLRRANFVVCVTEEHAVSMRRANPEIHPGKFVTIPNGFDGAEWDGVEDDGGGLVKKDKFVIAYTGSFYHKRNPRPLFGALRALIDACELSRDRIHVDLIGSCDLVDGRRVTEIAAEYGLAECVSITGPLSRAETLRRMARASLLLLLAEEARLQIPGKTYEYLRAGRPILALASEGAVARLLRRTGGAWVVDPNNEIGVATAIREAYGHWTAERDGPTADQAVVAEFDRRALAGRFADLFETGMSDVARLRKTLGVFNRVPPESGSQSQKLARHHKADENPCKPRPILPLDPEPSLMEHSLIKPISLRAYDHPRHCY